MIKTTGLWFIFYFVVTIGLSRPLSKITEVVSQIKFASESKDLISLEYPYEDELGSLTKSMNKMQERLLTARRELEIVNENLEQTVKERTQSLYEALNFSETILHSSPLPMGVYTSKGKCVLANNAYATLFDTTREALLSQKVKNLDSWKRTQLLDQCVAALNDHAPKKIEVNIKTSLGKPLWLECRILPTHINGEDHLLIQFIDLTERKRIEEDLRHSATHDSLTRLPNRRLLLDRLEQALRSSKRQNSYLAVLFLDLNKFKELNDTYGHDVGDKMLIEVANRLNHTVRDTDTVARLGGDEFVILLEGLGSESEQADKYASSVADKISNALSTEYDFGVIQYQSSASIGIKLFLGDEEDPDQIIKEADETMYKSKKGSVT